MNRRINRRRGCPSWIPRLAHDIACACVGFCCLLVLIASLSVVASFMGVL